MSKFKFRLIDPSGKPIPANSLWGGVGFSQTHVGTLCDEDRVVAAIRKLLNDPPQNTHDRSLDQQETLLVRSLIAAWLTKRNPALTDAIVYSVPLPASVEMLGQIGFLDRTVGGVVNLMGGLASVGISIFLFDYWSTMWPEDDNAAGLAAFAIVETGSWLLPSALEDKIDRAFGEPGSAVARSKFESNLVFELTKLYQLRRILKQLEFDAPVLATMQWELDRRLFSLFLLNSRQLEGLMLCGAAESTAAVAAHAAIALTIGNFDDSHDLFQEWERAIGRLKNATRAEEAQRTLATIKRNLENEPQAIERQINRCLASAAAAEAIGLVTTPVSLSFELMAVIAGGMAQVTPQGHFRAIVESAKQGMSFARDASEATPDVIADTVGHGISAEAWLRKKVAQFWPAGGPAGGSAADANTNKQ